MKDIGTYMRAYWEKYPNEREHDYTIEELLLLLDGGAECHLTDYLLIIYKKNNDHVMILFYCCDGGSQDKTMVKHILLQHRAFVKMFDIPIFIDGLKGLFKRSSISKYDEDKKIWRFV